MDRENKAAVPFPPVIGESALESNITTLTHRIDASFDVVRRLEDCLSHILTEQSTEPIDIKSPYAAPTILSERIARLCSKMDDLLSLIETLERRIDL